MATRLAQMGFVVLVHTYTLFPDALIPQMVEETSKALSWALDNVEARYKGDPSQISVVGHSAGAHLVALSLLHRAEVAEKKVAVPEQQPPQQLEPRYHTQRKGSQHQHFQQQGTRPAHPRIHIDDGRMPARFVGICGAHCPLAKHAHHMICHANTPRPHFYCPRSLSDEWCCSYDIAAHYEYEKSRGVHLLSMMARAFGHKPFFDALSPSVLLEACMQGTYMQEVTDYTQQGFEGI
eukprot:1161028-Pelagomonas_calceolata.AAC.3